MGLREEKVLLRQVCDRNPTWARRVGRRVLYARQTWLLALAGLLDLGCDSLLNLNHDYTIWADGTGGTSGILSFGGTTSIPMAGATSVGLGGSTFGMASSGDSTSSAATSGGSGTDSSTTSIVSAGGGSVRGTAPTSSTGGLATGGSTTSGTNSGGAGPFGSSSSAISTGGIAAGGKSSTGISTGGVATSRSSSRVASGGFGTGGVSSMRTTTGGVGTGGGTAIAIGAGGSSDRGGAGSGGGSNCAACNHGITFQSEAATAQHGSSSSSGVAYTAHQDRCPNNQVLMGYAATLRDDVYQSNNTPVTQLASLVAICGTINVGATGQVTVTPASGLDPRGTDGAAGTSSQICPANQVVVGFAGHSGAIIDQIGFVCASLSSTASACCCNPLTIGSTYAFTPVGGTGGSVYSESCPRGQVALGQSLYTATTTKHAGEEWVSFFGLLCATPMPVVACES
jgi:hypothetical protein